MADDRLGDDLLVGVEAIAAFLQWKARRVYYVAEIGSMPIHKIEGLGIVARKTTLLAFFDNLDSPFVRKSCVDARSIAE